MTWEVGAVICGALLMVFVLACGLIAICLVLANRSAPVKPALIIDPEQPDLAIDSAGQLVDTATGRAV